MYALLVGSDYSSTNLSCRALQKFNHVLVCQRYGYFPSSIERVMLNLALY